MFSKSRIHEPGTRPPEDGSEEGDGSAGTVAAADTSQPQTQQPAESGKSKAPASLISPDLTITGNLQTAGDVQVEGRIEGDIRAHLLTVGESATIQGEIMADDVVVNGRVTGRLRGLKVRLSSSARVEGDIIHKTIAIESGAHFEGSVQRQDNPIEAENAQTGNTGGGKTQSGSAKPQQQGQQQPAQGQQKTGGGQQTGAAAAAAARRPTPPPEG